MTEPAVWRALEDTAGKSVRLRLEDGTEVEGELGDVADGNVTLHREGADQVVAVDEIADVITWRRSADPE